MQRFQTLKRKILAKILPVFLVCILRFLALFIRFDFKISPLFLEKLSKNEPFITAFWHGELLFQPFLFEKYAKDKKAWVLISRHFDGEIISGVIKYFGANALRGSSSKGGIRALLGALKKLEQKEYIVITPDGPRGPYHSVADGIVLLAQKANVPIFSSRILFSNAWEFKSWDRFKIPKPFSKIQFVVQDCFYINGLELKEAKNYIKSKMEELN